MISVGMYGKLSERLASCTECMLASDAAVRGQFGHIARWQCFERLVLFIGGMMCLRIVGSAGPCLARGLLLFSLQSSELLLYACRTQCGGSLSELQTLAFICGCRWTRLNRSTTYNCIRFTVTGCSDSARR